MKESEELLGTWWGTHWERHGNTLRTTKKPTYAPTLPQKKKKREPFGVMLPRLIGSKIFFCLLVFYHFGPRL